MFSYSTYWPSNFTRHSNYNIWDYGQTSESKETTEEQYTSERTSRARSASPLVDRGTRGVSIARSILDLSAADRFARSLSVPREISLNRELESSSSSAKHSSYQVLSSHDVISKPFYRSFYYIKPRPDTSLYTPRSYESQSRQRRESSVQRSYREASVPRAYRESSVSRAFRETSVPRAYKESSVSRAFRETSVPRAYRETSYYEPRETSYGGRYFSKYHGPKVEGDRYYHRSRYPFVSSSLFLPRYYPGTLTVPYIYAASRLHI